MPQPEENGFPSLHARCYRRNGQLCSIYEIGRSLSAKELKTIVNNLNAQGIPVTRLDFYEYAPSDSMRHLFVGMQGATTPIPYFQLDKDVWLAIVMEITTLFNLKTTI